MELIAISENSDDTRTNQVYNGHILQTHTLSTLYDAPSCINVIQQHIRVNLARCAYPFIIVSFFSASKSLLYQTGQRWTLCYSITVVSFISSFGRSLALLIFSFSLFSVCLMWACVDINVYSLFIHMHYVLSNRLHSHWRRTSTQMNICSVATAMAMSTAKAYMR